MNQQDLEVTMMVMQLYPYRQPTAEDRARQAQVDLAFERAEADQRRDDAYKKLYQAIGDMLEK